MREPTPVTIMSMIMVSLSTVKSQPTLKAPLRDSAGAQARQCADGTLPNRPSRAARFTASPEGLLRRAVPPAR